MFPIVWATLAKQQQINLAKPIISMLSKEFHQRQSMMRPNVVQVGGGVSVCVWLGGWGPRGGRVGWGRQSMMQPNVVQVGVRVRRQRRWLGGWLA